jgi:predicted HTH transcriptional regulator
MRENPGITTDEMLTLLRLTRRTILRKIENLKNQK